MAGSLTALRFSAAGQVSAEAALVSPDLQTKDLRFSPGMEVYSAVPVSYAWCFLSFCLWTSLCGSSQAKCSMLASQVVGSCSCICQATSVPHTDLWSCSGFGCWEAKSMTFRVLEFILLASFYLFWSATCSGPIGSRVCRSYCYPWHFLYRLAWATALFLPWLVPN